MSKVENEIGTCSVCGDHQELTERGKDQNDFPYAKCRICFILGAEIPTSEEAHAPLTFNQAVALMSRVVRIITRQV